MSNSDPPESWDDKTDPDSLVGMRKALRANTAAVGTAVEWAVKTYNIVSEDRRRLDRVETMVKQVHGDRFVLPRALMVAVTLISLVTFACEMLR